MASQFFIALQLHKEALTCDGPAIFPQPHPRAFAVLLHKDDAGRLQGTTDGGDGPIILRITPFKARDSGGGDAGSVRQLPDTHL